MLICFFGEVESADINKAIQISKVSSKQDLTNLSLTPSA